MSQNLKQLQMDWLEDLEIGQGRSGRTAANYDHYLQAFFAKEEIGNVSEITLDTVREFRQWLSNDHSLATQNYYLIALRQFLKYLAKRDIRALASAKVELAKLPEREIDVLYPEEVDGLLTAPEGEEIESFRDRTILQVLFSTGMRVSELVSLDRDDVRSDTNELPIRGKGNKVRVVFLSDDAKGAIDAYVDKREDIDPALFIRHHPTRKAADGKQEGDLRLSVRTIQRMMKKYAAMAGITKNITPHTLRHSFATDLLSNGADVREVQQLLGHASITTTQIYTHLTDTRLREVHEKYHRKSKD